MVGSGMATALLLIRIATQHLTPEELGLWAFCFSSVGYFLLLDFGVSNSLGRLFADSVSKGDHRGTSGWLLLTMCILTLQGCAIALVGLLLRDPLIGWFDIPAPLVSEAKSLWTWLIVLQAVTLPGRALPGIIHAQNRVYNIHLFSILTAWINVALFWLWIRDGAGVMSYAYASAVAVGFTQLGFIFTVFTGRDRLHFSWVKIPWEHLRELFSYAGVIFILGLATQAMVASQGLIVTKLIGLEALAILSITGRLPSMANNLVARPFNATCPRWVLQFTGSDQNKFRREYGLLLQLTMLASVAACAFIVLINGPFVRWWTKPEFYGGNLLSVLLCLALLPAILNQCLGFAFHLTKKMSLYAIVLLIGSAVELASSILLVKYLGLPGIPLATLLSAGLVTVWFHLVVGGRMLSVPAATMLAREWPAVLASAVLLAVAALWILPQWQGSPLAALIVSFALSCLCVLPIAWRLLTLIREISHLRTIA
jgi:O-antigen/teichoic acid export membrane protein